MTLAVNYSDGYVNDVRVVDEPIRAWTTVDLNMTYDFGAQLRTGFLQDTRLSLGVSNLFNEAPPRVDLSGVSVGYTPLGFDTFNADPLGRYMTLRFSKGW